MRLVASVVLALNVLWFGLGFRLFALRPRQAIRLLVPAEARDELSRRSFVDALPFLGGMNLAFASLSAAHLAWGWARGAGTPWTIFFASGLAHATQLACNVRPFFRGGRAGGASWDVRGLMLFIFVVDGLCALANVVPCVL